MQAGYILERQGMLVVQIRKAQFSKFDQFEDESHLNSIFVVRKNNNKKKNNKKGIACRYHT